MDESYEADDLFLETNQSGVRILLWIAQNWSA
jgi:hypothetical protein